MKLRFELSIVFYDNLKVENPIHFIYETFCDCVPCIGDKVLLRNHLFRVENRRLNLQGKEHSIELMQLDRAPLRGKECTIRDLKDGGWIECNT